MHVKPQEEPDAERRMAPHNLYIAPNLEFIKFIFFGEKENQFTPHNHVILDASLLPRDQWEHWWQGIDGGIE